MPPPRSISLFTGAGGLDYGLEAAGYETRVAVEIDEVCRDTLEANRGWPVICGDIHDVPPAEALEVAGLSPGEAEILVGGPPCQPFSKSGLWHRGETRGLEDPRASTLTAYLEYVEAALPKVFLLENVHGIRYSGKEDGFALIEQIVQGINSRQGTNYRMSWKVVNMADYGVPQLRKRFFLIGSREGLDFHFPEETHAAPAGEGQLALQDTALQPYATSWDAIGHLDVDEAGLDPRGRWADLLPSIPEGQNYLWHTDRRGGLPLFGWRTRYWSFLLKLAKNLPSWTIQAQPGPAIGPFHWTSRRLSAEEMARIQTFPESIRFAGDLRDAQRQIGNAVPSLMSEILGREIMQQMLHEDPPGGPLTLSVPHLAPPPPEPAEEVPEPYLHLVGEHPEHPGVGKGAMYQDRVG